MLNLRRVRRLSAAAALVSLSISAASATDTICEEVDRFHQASFDSNVQPAGHRWVELHWTGFWMNFETGFGKRCRSSADAASRQLCEWLVRNSSTEFPGTVPRRILACYGHRFPVGAEWRNWRSDVTVFSDDRWLLLEIDLFTMRSQTGAIRLSSFAENQDDATVEMPPLAPIDG